MSVSVDWTVVLRGGKLKQPKTVYQDSHTGPAPDNLRI